MTYLKEVIAIQIIVTYVPNGIICEERLQSGYERTHKKSVTVTS